MLKIQLLAVCIFADLPRSSHACVLFVLFCSAPQPQIVPPPPDVQPIIDRMAMYVAKNGVEFELVVKSKRDQRFAFLEPGHVHFQYYDFKKNMFLKVSTTQGGWSLGLVVWVLLESFGWTVFGTGSRH